MSIFEDKVFENMDWLNQTIEPIVFSGNDVLLSMPSVIEIPKEDIMTTITSNATIYYSKIIRREMNARNIAPGYYKLLSDAYVIKSPDESILIDLRDDCFPTILLEKTIDSMDDKSIMQYVVDRTHEIISYHTYSYTDTGRINELLDILDSSKHFPATRSLKKKRQQISQCYRIAITTDAWRIRDADLMIRIAHWINTYAQDGNLASLRNLSLMKVMTHKNKPIYSIKEETK